MDRLNLYDLCVIARSLDVDFSKLTYEEGGIIYLPTSTGSISANSSQIEESNIEYNQLSVLIRVLKDIFDYRSLPF